MNKKNNPLFPQWLKLITILSLALPAYPQVSNIELATKIDDYMTGNIANGFAGSILVAKNGEIILSKGYGLANRNKNIPVTTSTVFNIGSVTKQFTAAAILKLVEQNKISVSDSISKYFDDVPADKKSITIHHLLTHTAGISPNAGGFRYDYSSREKFLADFFVKELIEKPGTVHIYANAGYIVLAALIEYVSEQDYEEFLQEHIFTPAGMKNTGYKIPKWSTNQLAHSYFFNLAEVSWTDWGATPERWSDKDVSWYGIGKGDIQSTSEDLYKWHIALEANTVLSAKSREMFEKPYVVEDQSGSSHYAYGWAIFRTNKNKKIVSHDGSNGLYYADFMRFVDDHVVVIYLTSVAPNSFRTNAAKRGMISGNNIESGAKEIARLVFLPNYKPKRLPKPNSYDLVFKFVNSNNPSNVGSLGKYLSENQGQNIRDRSVLNRIGLHFMRNRNWDWAIVLLTTNIQYFPDDGNLWDTLGETYMNSGDDELAIESFNQALKLAPKIDCYWCQNSKKLLQKLNSAH